MTVLAYCYMRLSTAEQLEGTGEKRQLDLFERYVAAHGLSMAGDVLNDRGVSAFHGSNLDKGELGKFVDAVERGDVAAGSFLLVESLDRLTRQEPLEALDLVMRIIKKGVNLVTVSDGRLLNSRNFDALGILATVLEVARGNSESVMKSQRVGAAWATKRADIEKFKLTSRCPGWLVPRKDGNKIVAFDIDPIRAEIVKRIFEESASGVGNLSIARRLNERGIPPFGKPKGIVGGRPVSKNTPSLWHQSSVAKILASKSVLGEFQPHVLISKKKRKSTGPVIRDYFPPVVDSELFFRAQNARSLRAVGGGGPRGQFVSNLFSGLAKCAYCGSSMVFEDHGSGPKGGRYLVCSLAKRDKTRCSRKGWRYDRFEAAFLAFVDELDLSSIVNSSADSQAREVLRKSIEANVGRRDEFLLERERVYDLLTKVESTAFVADKLNECDRNLARTDQLLVEQRAELSRLEQSQVQSGKLDIIELLQNLNAKNDQDLFRTRAAIAFRLKSLVEGLYLAPVGSSRRHSHRTDATERIRQDGDGAGMLIDYMSKLQPIDRNAPYFTVAMRGQRFRIIYPAEGNTPSLSRSILLADGEATIT